jgi:pyridinium-3,5-bisthiocarboxylic acid mononucleotide nickel chelatase
MRILYYECFSGISGDMNLGAMLDAGVDSKYLLSELSKLNIDDEFKIEINKDSRKGITGTKVDVVIKHSHHHRNLKDIENIICGSDINIKVKELSLKIFMKVAKAEAKIH